MFHERSPYDTLNANLHAGETLAARYAALESVYGRPVNIFLQGARRSILHTLDLHLVAHALPARGHRGAGSNARV